MVRITRFTRTKNGFMPRSCIPPGINPGVKPVARNNDRGGPYPGVRGRRHVID